MNNNASSDDRLKINEELLIDASKTLMKLRPQKYEKYEILDSQYVFNQTDDPNWVGRENKRVKELGFIAQEIYYECPELRDLIHVPADAILIDDDKIKDMKFDDIKNDPDYSNWGSTPASIHYISFIALLTKGFQEQHSEIDKLKKQNQLLEQTLHSLIQRITMLESIA